MLRGFYGAASGMITQQRYHDALGNNVANMNTPGYKEDQAVIRSFPEQLLQAQGGKQLPVSRNVNIPFNQTIGSLNTGVYVQEMVPRFTQGDIRETSIGTDLALVQTDVPDETGSLFFRVQNEAGEERLTRNGNFTVDGNGFFVTNQGYYVLDEAGNPIETGGMEFVVNADGTLLMEDGQVNLGIGYVVNTNDLVKEGDNLYNGESVAPGAAQYVIRQGYVEGSNVDAARTMTEMMTSYRLYEANQRVLRAYDQSLDKAVNDIGRLT